jgi:hypothetical protein
MDAQLRLRVCNTVLRGIGTLPVAFEADELETLVDRVVEHAPTPEWSRRLRSYAFVAGRREAMNRMARDRGVQTRAARETTHRVRTELLNRLLQEWEAGRAEVLKVIIDLQVNGELTGRKPQYLETVQRVVLGGETDEQLGVDYPESSPNVRHQWKHRGISLLSKSSSAARRFFERYRYGRKPTKVDNSRWRG